MVFLSLAFDLKCFTKSFIIRISGGGELEYYMCNWYIVDHDMYYRAGYLGYTA